MINQNCIEGHNAKRYFKYGRKAKVNVRLDENGGIITEGEQVLIGGNERYTAICYPCLIQKQKNKNNIINIRNQYHPAVAHGILEHIFVISE